MTLTPREREAYRTPPPTMRELMGHWGYRPACTIPGRTVVIINPHTNVMVSEWVMVRHHRWGLDILAGRAR